MQYLLTFLFWLQSYSLLKLTTPNTNSLCKNTKYKYTAKMFVSCIPGIIKWLIKGGAKYIFYFTHTIQCLARKIYQGTMKTEYRMPVDQKSSPWSSSYRAMSKWDNPPTCFPLHNKFSKTDVSLMNMCQRSNTISIILFQLCQ